MSVTDLGYRKVSRSAYAHDTGQALDIYLGTCQQHDRPVRHEGTAAPIGAGRYWITCPEDGGHDIPAERLVAVTSHVTCDGACMGARRAFCDCGCGGANHGKSWGTTVTRKDYESALVKYRDSVAKVEAKREQRREAEQRRARRDFDTWAGEHAALVTALDAHKPDELGYPQPGSNDFLCDLARQVSRGKILTDNQVSAAERSIERQQERATEAAAREAAKKPCPEGKRVTISGTIAKITCREGYMPGSAEVKAIIDCDGYAVWVTVPRAIETWATDNRRRELWDGWTPSYHDDYDGASYRWTRALRGMRVTLTADITRSDRDESFGFGKRPTVRSFEMPEAAGDAE